MYLLGNGTYGSVYQTDDQRAIKKADRYYSWISLREMVTMKYINLYDIHPMVKLDSVSYSEESIIMELAEIDVQNWLNSRPNLSRRCLILRNIIESVYILHQIGIVHGDLKTANLVLVKNKVKLIDFGFSGPPKWAFTQYTTPIYKDSYQTNGFSSDIYALGIIMIELLTGNEFEIPPDNRKIKEVTHKISKDYRYFIRSMVGDPKKRPNITQVMDRFGMEAIVLPSLKQVTIRSGNLSGYHKRAIDNLLTLCKISGPNKVSDFFDLVGLFTAMPDFQDEVQFYILAVIYVYSAYFHNPVNYPTLLSMAPSYYSRKNRKIKLAKKIDFLINNEQFIIKLFSLIN